MTIILAIFIIAIISTILALRSMRELEYVDEEVKKARMRKIRGSIVFFNKIREHYSSKSSSS